MRKSQRLVLSTTLTGLLISACSSLTPSTPRDLQVLTAIDQTLEESQGSQSRESQAANIPRDVTDALVPALQIGNSQQSLEEERFDITVQKAPAADFFMGLVEGTEYNMVVHPDISGEVTLELKNITVPDVMKIMRDVYGFEYKHNGSIFHVLPGGIRTKVFKIDYLNVNRKGVSQMQVSVGSVRDSSNNNNNNNNNNSYGNNNNNASNRGNSGFNNNNNGNNNNNSGNNMNGQTGGASLQTESEADFWKDLEESIKTIIGVGEAISEASRSVVVNAHAGVVVVRALPHEVRSVEEFLRQAELIMQRQVILEAKILEVQLKDGFQSGINWNTFGELANSLAGTGQFGSMLDESGNIVYGSNNTTAGAFNYSAGTPLQSPFGTSFAFNFNFGDFTGLINLLESQGTVQVLSSPRISTINNQKAVIKVGQDEFFVTSFFSSVSTGDNPVSTQAPEFTAFFSGIALDVTPQISENGDIILHIHPTVSEVSEQVKTVGGLELPLASSSIRESDSIVKAKNGQVIVIGGLMQTTSVDDNAGLPGGRKLPLLGYLFSNKQQKQIKSELVILLRPVLIENDRSWNETLTESQKNIRSIREKIEPPFQ